jgi:hypothetical protein
MEDVPIAESSRKKSFGKSPVSNDDNVFTLAAELLSMLNKLALAYDGFGLMFW